MTTNSAINTGTGASNTMMQGQGAGTAPAFSTSTWPATTTINQLLYSSSANTVAGLATANSATLITSAGGIPSLSQTLPSAVQGNITSVGALASGSLTTGFTAVTVPIGGTGNTTFTAYSVICGGTTATGSFQNVSGLGSSGQVLTSQGAGALPQWANASGTGTVNSGTQNDLAYYATSTNAVSALATANNGTLVTNGSGVPSISSTLPAAVQQNIDNGYLGIPFKNMQVFTSSGTFTPSSTTSSVRVKVWGGGGGGGGGSVGTPGAGGAGGGYSEGFVTVTPSVGVTVTVGVAGSGGATSGNGSAGGASSFAGGSTLTGNGGAGGTFGGGASSGGTASGGTLNVTGQNGQTAGAANFGGGAGGNPFGMGGAGQGSSSGSNGLVAAQYGCGGSGGDTGGAYTGGNGSAGLVIVYY